VPSRAINPDAVFDSLQYGFSQAVEVTRGRRLYLSGQVAVDREERTEVHTLRGQLEQSFDNIALVLAAAGAELADVVMLRIYLVEAVRDELDEVVAVLRERFGDAPPASTWLLVSGFARSDWLVEIEAEAFVTEESPVSAGRR